MTTFQESLLFIHGKNLKYLNRQQREWGIGPDRVIQSVNINQNSNRTLSSLDGLDTIYPKFQETKK